MRQLVAGVISNLIVSIPMTCPEVRGPRRPQGHRGSGSCLDVKSTLDHDGHQGNRSTDGTSRTWWTAAARESPALTWSTEFGASLFYICFR